MDKKTDDEFNKWNRKKQETHIEKQRPFFHEREVWFCSLGVNIGFEQDGRGLDFLRPVMILKKFNNQIFWALPMTKNVKEGKYYYVVSIGARKQSALILSQIRLVDAKRLAYKIGAVKQEDLAIIKQKIKQLLA